MEHDTEQSAPTGSMNQQEYNSKSMHMLRTKSRGHHHHFSPPSLEKSLPNIPIERGSVSSRKTNHQCPDQAMAYHESYNTAKSRYQNNQNADNCMHNKNIDDDIMRRRSSPDMISILRNSSECDLPQLPLALSDDAHPPPVRFSSLRAPSPLPLLSTSASVIDGGNGNGSVEDSVAHERDKRLHKSTVSIQSIDEQHQILHEEHDESITNSPCVPVEGKLVDLSDNESYTNHDADAANDHEEEGGIVILDESTEEEYEESIRTASEDTIHDQQQQHKEMQYHSTAQLNSNNNITKQCIETTHAEISSLEASTWEHDTIVLEASSRENNTNLIIPVGASNMSGHESLNFEQLLEEADDTKVALPKIEDDEEDGDDGSVNENIRETPSSEKKFWQLNLFSSSNRRSKSEPQALITQPLPHHTPVRATRIQHDKFVIEVDIVPSNENDNSSRLDTRDVTDIMANIELLPLWFDPVPAVFEATCKDGSSTSESLTSPSNSLEEGENHSSREYDGQWVEISTPPLTVPSDSRVSGCFRAIRVTLRSMVGFPARIRSMIFVERSCGRIGMTLGPFPDGTTAYHTFTIQSGCANDENGGSTRQCVVVSDEVRLQRGSDFNETRSRGWYICSIFRCIIGFIELFIRWYRPDEISYMHQTISSMNKLRSLVERGESATCDYGELIVDGDEQMMLSTPLLG